MIAFGIQVKKEDIKTIYKELGKDINEALNFKEFIEIMQPRIGDKQSKEEIERIFKIFDED